jgi:outer membrane protein
LVTRECFSGIEAQRLKIKKKNKVSGLLLLVMILGILFKGGLAEGNTADPAVVNTTVSLEQAIEMALSQNLSLQRTQLGVTDSHIALQSKQADFHVKIIPTGLLEYSSADQGEWHAGATVSKKTEEGLTFSVIPGMVNRGEGYETGVGAALNVPLLRGLGKENVMDGVYSGVFAYENARLSFYRQQVDIVLQAVAAVYNSIKTQQQIVFLENQTKNLREHLALAKIKEKNGLITAIDLYRAEIRIKEVQDELTGLREEYANALDKVKELLAIPQGGEIAVTAPVDLRPVETSPEKALEIALENRIELEQGKLAIREAERKQALAKNNLLPQLDMNVRYNRFADNASLTGLPEDSWIVSFSSNTDLLRTQEANNFERSKLAFQQATLDYREQKERIAKDVRSQLNSLEKQGRSIAISKEQIVQTTGKMKLSESKFRHGMGNNFDLLESQTQLQRAKTNLLFDTINYIIGTYRLRSVLGTLVAREAGVVKENK